MTKYCRTKSCSACEWQNAVELNPVDLIVVEAFPVELIPCRPYYDLVLELII